MKKTTTYRKEIQIIQYLYQFLDLTAIITGGIIAYHIRGGSSIVDPRLYALAIIICSVYAIIIFPLFGAYNQKYANGRFSAYYRTILAWGMVMVVLALTAFLTKTGAYYSRLWFLMWLGYSAALLFVLRFIVYKILNTAKFKAWSNKRVLIVGTGPLANNVTKKIAEADWVGMNIIGLVSINNADTPSTADETLILGTIDHLESLVIEKKIDEIWLTLPLKASDTIQHILYLMRHSTVNIRMVPDIFNLRLLNHSVSEIAGIPVLNLCESPMLGIGRALKITEDFTMAFMMLLFSMPIMCFIAFVIKLTSNGPVFYCQQRVGWNGKVFSMYKFRSMPVDAEKNTGPVWARKDDNRAKGLGGLLRRTSLDELPQLINVLKGDMSIVGPRPERPVFVEEFRKTIPDYMKKHMVKAGITGWAQVNGWRGDTDLSKRIEYDLYYIENWSIWFDFKIMALTITRGFIDENAY